MESITLITSLALAIVLVYVFFFRKTKEVRDKKSYYLKRFLRNKEQSLKYINEIKALVEQNDGWNKKAFLDKETTFSEYLEVLNTKYESDYSESSYQILKRNKLTNAQKQEYTRKLIEQSEDLYLMEIDLGILNKTWNKSVS